ncbi:hypothetical protein BJ165DRAFT_1399555 [Panaeolus papilionaceus]|nr:hypothetical protein BJ165DRAFT_1399555 [Panaeolus papilionaceus]
MTNSGGSGGPAGPNQAGGVPNPPAENLDPFVITENEAEEFPHPSMPDWNKKHRMEFSPERPETLVSYLKLLEMSFVKAGVTKDRTKKGSVVLYLGDPKTASEWESVLEYRVGTYEEFKKALFALYPEAERLAKGSYNREIVTDILSCMSPSFAAVVKTRMSLQYATGGAGSQPLAVADVTPLTHWASYSDVLKVMRSLTRENDTEEAPSNPVSATEAIASSVQAARKASSTVLSTPTKVKQEYEELSQFKASIESKLDDKLDKIQAVLQERFAEDDRRAAKQEQEVRGLKTSFEILTRNPTMRAARPFANNYASQVSAGGAPGGSSCFYCKEANHFISDCPHKLRHVQERRIYMNGNNVVITKTGVRVPSTVLDRSSMKDRVEKETTQAVNMLQAGYDEEAVYNVNYQGHADEYVSRADFDAFQQEVSGTLNNKFDQLLQRLDRPTVQRAVPPPPPPAPQVSTVQPMTHTSMGDVFLEAVLTSIIYNTKRGFSMMTMRVPQAAIVRDKHAESELEESMKAPVKILKPKNKKVRIVEESDSEEEDEPVPKKQLAKPNSKGERPYVSVPPRQTKPLGQFHPITKNVEEVEDVPLVERKIPSFTKKAPVEEEEEVVRKICEELWQQNVPMNLKKLIAVSDKARRYYHEMMTKRRVPRQNLRAALLEEELDEEEMDTVDQMFLSEEGLPETELQAVGDEEGLVAGAYVLPDLVAQYAMVLAPEEEMLTVVVGDESRDLRTVYPDINSAGVEEALLDGGSQICSIEESVARRVGLSWTPQVRVRLQSANKSVTQTLGLARNVPFKFGNIIAYLQLHVIPEAAYQVLLGRPFEVVTALSSKNETTGDQTITLTDPNTGEKISMPTYARNKPPPHIREKLRKQEEYRFQTSRS